MRHIDSTNDENNPILPHHLLHTDAHKISQWYPCINQHEGYTFPAGFGLRKCAHKHTSLVLPCALLPGTAMTLKPVTLVSKGTSMQQSKEVAKETKRTLRRC